MLAYRRQALSITPDKKISDFRSLGVEKPQTGTLASYPTLRPIGLVRGFFETLLGLSKRSELPLLSTLQSY